VRDHRTTWAVLGLWLVALPALAADPDPAVADAAVRAYLARNGIPAAHVTVLRGDEVLLQRGYGAARPGGPPPDAHSIFPLGSISKQFTAALVLALADQGRIELDAPVGRYLPEWFAGEPELRVEHLLWQTSGLADFLWLPGYRKLGDDPATPVSAYVALGAAAPRRFAPGTRWAYSNTNYKALALIAERTGGAPFDRLLETHVLRPHGIEDIVACHDLRPEQFVPGLSQEGHPRPLDPSRAAYAGDGGLCGDAASLAVWLERAFTSRDGRPATMSRLARPARLDDGTLVPYGYGVSVRPFLGRNLVWHGGNVDSHSTLIARLPDEDLRVVILLARGFLWPTDVLAPLIGAEPPQPVATNAGAATGAGAGTRAGAGATTGSSAALAGRYEDGLFRYDIVPDGAALKVGIDLIGPLRFLPSGPGEYVAVDHPATFTLRLPADGRGWSASAGRARHTTRPPPVRPRPWPAASSPCSTTSPARSTTWRR
jgi:D-alanyl-D-alanine carboxypeptidase